MAIKIMIIFFSNGIESLIPAPMLYITSFLFFFLKKLSEDHQPRVALTWGMAVFFSNSEPTSPLKGTVEQNNRNLQNFSGI